MRGDIIGDWMEQEEMGGGLLAWVGRPRAGVEVVVTDEKCDLSSQPVLRMWSVGLYIDGEVESVEEGLTLFQAMHKARELYQRHD